MMDHPIRPDHNSDDSDSDGFRPTPKQIGVLVLAVLLVVFIVANADPTPINFVVTSVTMPLWIVLAGTAAIAFVVGLTFGIRRTKRRYQKP